MKKKIILYFNYPSSYRKEIYSEIDKSFDCEWHFDNLESPPVKFFDTSLLSKVSYHDRHDFWKFKWTEGILSLLRKDTDTYIMAGEVYNLTILVFMLLKHVFFRKKKIILWSHGYYGYEKKINLLFLVKPFFRLADRLLIYNNRGRNMLIDDGIDPKNIYTIYNSLAYSKQILIRKQLLPSNILTNHFQNNNPTIVFIGRLTRVKRLNVLLEAVNYLRNQNRFFNILLIGDGEEKEKLERYVVDNGMNDLVWFYGECFDETINAELVFNSDICVSPGNVGLTAMHAMMFGTPVITHDNLAYQMPEFESIHENKTGAFFKENDVEDLGRAISKWFETHKGERNSIRQYCYKEIDTFWNPMNQMDIIRKVINNYSFI